MNEETLFHLAREKPPDERAVFLDEACADDTALRERLEILLAAHEHPGSFLQAAARDNGNGEVASVGGRTVYQSGVQEGPGTIIGPYKLLQQIGEGGMGVVFMAEQSQPVRRTVALKIIKPGMDSRQVIARFEAERQALAMMDHPNIARVLDAGTTDSGRPYFVMELVKGTPITEYCDVHHITPRERLELFVPVCNAVQHAHQKGIIHRDLKPSNVMIAMYDGRPVPKVIDFGVAKATGPKLTDRTMFTEFGAVVGTLEYMSPEQAELNQLDVDTRSDVYSLGVLLYELLTGTTPLEHKRVQQAALLEALRIIREEEPPRPSTRLSTTEQLPTIAASRGIEPKKLTGVVRGEVDWIVMKCLEKDRCRRYPTANALAADLQHYLSNEPVLACQPSVVYRLKKFMRRNQAAVLAVSAIIGLLMSAIVILAVSNARIRRESDAKEASLATTREAVRQMARLETQLDLRLNDIPEGDSIAIAMREDTLRYLEPIVKQAEIDDESSYEVFVILECIADIQSDLGRREEARRTCQRAIDIVQRRLDGDPESPIYLADLTRAKACMVRLMYFGGLPAENEPEFVAYCEELVELLREYNRRYPNSLQPVAFYLNALGSIKLDRNGDKIAAERLFRESVVLSKEYLSQGERSAFEWEQAAKSAVQLGRLLQDMSAAGPKEAAPMFEIAVQWAKTGLEITPSRWTRLAAANAELDLGICYFEMQPSEHAMSIVRRATSELRRLSIDHPSDASLIVPARQGQTTFVRQLQQLARAPEAAEAARGMADWLSDVTPQLLVHASLQKQLQKAQTETVQVLCSTGQLQHAIDACQQQISYWEELDRNKPQVELTSHLAGTYITLSLLLTVVGQFDEADSAAERAAEIGPADPQALNQLARTIVTDRNLEPAVSALALQAAQRATMASPADASCWKTLGVAQYRAGEWQAAIDTLKKADRMTTDGDLYHHFFLAMAHWRAGNQELARKCYDEANMWMEGYQPQYVELRAFREEAAELLNADDRPSAKATTQPESKTTRPRSGR